MKQSGRGGGVDEQAFTDAYEDVPKVHLFSARDLADHITKTSELLCDPNADWEKRIMALKSIRGMMIAGAADYDEFMNHLRRLQPALTTSVRELRSQVVREACITVAYLSQRLGSQFGPTVEIVLPSLLLLIQSSIKIMASSASLAIKIIIQHTCSPRLIGIINNHMTSKSTTIRRECTEILDQMFRTWPTSVLERHIAQLQEAVKIAINDPDAAVRALSRRAYWGFAKHFSDQAASLLNALDVRQQKMIRGDGPAAAAGSSTDGHQAAPAKRVASSQAEKSRTASRAASRERTAPSSLYSRSMTTSQTKRSASTAAKDRNGSVTNLTARQPKLTNQSVADRSRHKTRVGISQSQPTSRSNSPSSRMSYLTNTLSAKGQMGPGRVARKSRIPRSQGASREPSPSRTYGRERKMSGGGLRQAGSRLPGQGVLAQRVLMQGSDVEAAFADALSARSRPEAGELDDTMSETSSVSSERSHGSYGKMSEDLSDVLVKLESRVWSDRLDGLVALKHILTHRCPSRPELKKVTNKLTNLFQDPHGKIFWVLLDTIMLLLNSHASHIADWLPTCLTKLLCRMGGDMFGSLEAKVHCALDTVRDSFAYRDQLGVIAGFMVDQTQVINLKVKLAILHYIHDLLCVMDATDLPGVPGVRLAMSRVITWTTEPKNLDVRKAARTVIIALFNLNPSEYSLMLKGLPNTFMESAAKILHSHLHNQAARPVPERNAFTPVLNVAFLESASPINSVESEPMNREQIIHSIMQTSADIQNLSLNADADADATTIVNTSLMTPDVMRSAAGDDTASTTLLDTSATRRHDNDNGDDGRSTDTNTSGRGSSQQEMDEDAVMYSEDFSLFEFFGDHNDKLVQTLLTKMGGEGETADFRKVLSTLFETLGDRDADVRRLTLLMLREMVEKEPSRFVDYLELTVIKVLEAHRDSVKEVTRAAEDCLTTLASLIPADQSCRVLSDIIRTAIYPVNLAAIKMFTKVVNVLPRQTLLANLSVMVPGLVKHYEDAESSVRKACVFCLVAVYAIVGDDLRPYLGNLGDTKMKLLNLYINRSSMLRERNGNGND